MIDKIRNSKLKKILEENIDKLEIIFKVTYLLHLCFCFTVFGTENKVTLIPTLLFAGVLIIYRILKIKVYINYKNLKILLVLLFLYAVTSAIYIQYALIENIKCFIWMFMQFTLLYTLDIDKKKSKIIKELKIVSVAIIIFTAASSLCSLALMIIKHTSFYTTPSNTIYLVGIAPWGRLYGIGTDPNYVSVMSAITVLLSVYFFRNSDKKYIKILNILNIIIQMLFIAFAGSRSALVSLIIGAVFYVGIIILFNKHKAIKVISAILCVGICIYLSTNLIVKTYNKIDSMIERENETQPVEIGREQMVTQDISNRRFDIWKSGLEAFSKTWYSGIGFATIVPYSLDKIPDTYIVNNDLGIFPSYHNVVIDIFVSQGVIRRNCSHILCSKYIGDLF